MFKAIKQYFDANIARAGGDSDSKQPQRLATAALLIEVTRADHTVSDVERAAVDKAISDIFRLTSAETRALIQLAEDEVRHSTSLYQFTNLVDKEFSYEDKVRILEMMWSVVFADTLKDKHEEYLVRKVADLLHISHRDFIRTRHSVEEGLVGAVRTSK